MNLSGQLHALATLPIWKQLPVSTGYKDNMDILTQEKIIGPVRNWNPLLQLIASHSTLTHPYLQGEGKILRLHEINGMTHKTYGYVTMIRTCDWSGLRQWTFWSVLHSLYWDGLQ